MIQSLKSSIELNGAKTQAGADTEHGTHNGEHVYEFTRASIDPVS